MRLSDGSLRLSPSDLSAHLACPHLTTLELRAAEGEIVKPKLESPHRDLIFRKGNEHEAAYLARLVAGGSFDCRGSRPTTTRGSTRSRRSDSRRRRFARVRRR